MSGHLNLGQSPALEVQCKNVVRGMQLRTGGRDESDQVIFATVVHFERSIH